MLLNEMVTDTRLTHDMAKQLGISDSSLRRWCRILEFHGYPFLLGDDGARVFQEGDVAALKHFHILVKIKRMNLEDAAKQVIETREQQELTPPSMQLMTEEAAPQGQQLLQDFIKEQVEAEIRERLLTEMMALKQKLEYMDFDLQEAKVKYKKLLQDMAEQQEKIEELKGFIESRVQQRDKELMYALREIRQTKTMVAASRERRWWKFWTWTSAVRS